MTNDTRSMNTRPDFPDWLSPMLIKELRQGMRSRVFLFCFLAIQAAMIFLALMGLLKASVQDSIESISVFFWIIVGLPLLLIMPFSGLSSISREKTANTLELIFLTRLTARRIVFGKWIAIVAQTLLLVAAILPYAVMRYYLGGVNITLELTTLAWMLGGSALMTSVTVGLSPLMGRVGRVLMPFAIFIAMYIALIVISEMSMGVSMWRLDWQMAAVLALQSLFLALLMLEVGAGKIGPAAENHSTVKRLLALASTGTTVVYSYLPGAQWTMWLVTLLIAGPVLIGAVCEPIREIPSVYRPFLRLGVFGRALGRLLYPGWPAGVFFALLILVLAGFRIDELMTGAHYLHPLRAPGTHIRMLAVPGPTAIHPVPTITYLLTTRILEVAVLGAFLMPVAFFRLLRVKIPVPTLLYFLFHGALALLSLVGVLVTEYGVNHAYRPGPSGVEQALAWIPTCTLFLLSRIGNWGNEQIVTVLGGVSVVTFLTTLFLLGRLWLAWRTISALEKTAAALTPAAGPSSAPDAARPVPAA